MSWLSSFLHPGRGYDKAQEQLNNYYQQGKQYQQPFLDNLSNPGALRDQWEKGYVESDAAKNAENSAMQHGLNSASSMGLMGSNTALNALQSGTSQIAAEDKKSYLDDLMQKYMAAAGIANNMSSNANTMGQNSAQSAYGSQNAGGNMFANILGMGVGGFGSAVGNAVTNKGWNPFGGNK